MARSAYKPAVTIPATRPPALTHRARVSNPVRRLATLAALLLGACAMPGLRLDLAATAPLLGGYGQAGFAIHTASAQAQRHFDQGMQQAYAFNEAEAVRQFKAALAADPSCAMRAWGVAWQLGPNINAPKRGDLTEALRYADLARRRAADGPPRDVALIDAMALRYGQSDGVPLAAPLLADVCASAGQKRVHPLDLAYAERLRQLLPRFAGDADLLSLWAEAEMLASASDWWPEGQAADGRITAVARQLEDALLRQPAHIGMNHYLIHALDASPEVQRAVAAADRLGALAPLSPHLVHMPSHIHVRVGRYADATAENQRALALDDALATELQAQGFAVSKDWRGHNTRFAWFAALMEGRGDVALPLARSAAARAAQATHVWAELARSLPMLTLARLERWQAVLAEPVPTGDGGLADALAGEARGIALLRLGQPAQAQALLPGMAAGAAAVAKANAGTGDGDKMLRGMAQGAVEHLSAEIALAEGRSSDALAAQDRAVAERKLADAQEPPMLGAAMRLALGDLQARAGQASAAERTYRADLAAWPASGWALRGLQRALAAQGRQADAAAVAADLAQQWAGADPALR